MKIREGTQNILGSCGELILATLWRSTGGVMYRALGISVDTESIPQIRVQSDRSSTTSLFLVFIAVCFEVVE
jgi:hypothetical protein